jgi:hypothetical protein
MNDHDACPRVRTQAAIRWLGSLAPLATLATGCVFVVPVPTAYHPEGSRRNLTEETAGRFAPGNTTVDDVVLALGEPDEAAPDASWITYRWERVYMHLFWGWAIPAADAAIGQGWERTYSHEHSLRMTFDELGVLQTVSTTNDKVQFTDPP